MAFPAAVPEIPVADLEKASAYYMERLGFRLDWTDPQDGIAGLSRGNCRLFVASRSFRRRYGNEKPVLFWLNLESKAEVDGVFAEWQAAQARIVSAPEDKEWKLREFMVADLDGNLIRVFYDFRWDEDASHKEGERAQANGSEIDAPSKPILTSVAAHLYVGNLKASLDFFTSKLGFTVDFVYGNPPFYGQVSRDNARLALRCLDGSFFRTDIRRREDLLSASITVDTAAEIEQLFLSYQSVKVSFHQSLKSEPWGARTFIVLDPDGNLLLFAGPDADQHIAGEI